MSLNVEDRREPSSRTEKCSECDREQTARRFCIYCGADFAASHLTPLPLMPESRRLVANFDSVPYSGPSHPQSFVSAPPLDGWLPQVAGSAKTLLTWVGVSAGAGETTLERWLPGSVAGGHAWPSLGAPLVDERPVVLVARITHDDLERVMSATQFWAAGRLPTVRLLGVVFVPENQKRIPRALRDAMRIAAGGAPRAWQLPYVSKLVKLPELSVSDLPRAAQTVLSEIATLTIRK